MYSQITIDHNLFFIDDSYIINFQQIAQKMQPLLTNFIENKSYQTLEK